MALCICYNYFEQNLRYCIPVKNKKKAGEVMSEREKAGMLLDQLPDYQLSIVIAYMQGLMDAAGIEPNAETKAAIEELENGGGEVFSGSTDDFISKMLED